MEIGTFVRFKIKKANKHYGVEQVVSYNIVPSSGMIRKDDAVSMIEEFVAIRGVGKVVGYGADPRDTVKVKFYNTFAGKEYMWEGLFDIKDLKKITE